MKVSDRYDTYLRRCERVKQKKIILSFFKNNFVIFQEILTFYMT